jgi:hypothetical protein
MARRLLIAPDQQQPGSRNDQPPLQRDPIYGEVVLDASVDESCKNNGGNNGQNAQTMLPEESNQSFTQRLRHQAYRCGEVTVRHLVESEYLSGPEGQSILQSYGYYINDLPERGSILDLIAFLVWIKLESRDEKAIKEMRNLTQMMSAAFQGKITHCGFAHLTETPIELYQSNARVYQISSSLMCPVIQAHESDFVSVVSVNPITAASAGLLITKQLEKETGVRPFVFVMTTDSNAWTWLCEKHFGS